MTEAAGLVFWEVQPPRPLAVERVVEWLAYLAAGTGRGRLVFEARADSTGVRFLLGSARREAERLRRHLAVSLPGVQLITDSADYPIHRRAMQAVARLRQRPTSLPLDSESSEATSRALLTSLTGALRRDETAVVQLLLGPHHGPRALPSQVPDPAASVWTLLTKGQPPADTEVRRRLSHKRAQAGFGATVRLGVSAGRPERRRQLIMTLFGALATLQTPGVRLDLVREAADRLITARTPWRWPLHLSVSEIAPLLGWPYGDDDRDLPGLPPVHPKPLRAVANVHQGPRVFARSAVAGDSRQLGISPIDQTYHTVAYGPSGSGKTSALLHLILADIAAGRPVLVLDPKYQLITDILARLPEHRLGDVVELNAADRTPIGFNPLDVSGRDPDVVVDGILAVFQAVFHEGWGARTSDIFSASLRTLARTSTPDRPATLLDIPRLLTDPVFRRSLIGQVQDDVGLAGFWAWYEQQSPAAQAAVIAAPLNKLRQFLLRPALARMLDQRDGRFRLRDVFRHKQIVLVPLNEGLIGPGTASLLGNLVIADVWQATQERADGGDTSPATVYVDEAPRFLNLGVSLADALAISRSLGVGWCLAAQFRSQFPPDLRTAVDINARSKLVFATEHDDARDMAKLAPGLVAEDFMALPRYHAYANLVADGLPSGWALVATLPPPPATGDPEQRRALIRQRYRPTPPPPPEEPARSEPPTRPPERIGRRRRQRRPSS